MFNSWRCACCKCTVWETCCLIKSKRKVLLVLAWTKSMFIRMVVKHSCGKELELLLCFKTKGHIICMVFVFTQIFGKSHFYDAFFHTRAYSRRSVMCTEITFYSNWPFSSVLAFVYSLICKYDLRSSSALRDDIWLTFIKQPLPSLYIFSFNWINDLIVILFLLFI